MNDKWLRLDLSAAPELTDALANFLEEIGAEGVCQEALVPPSRDPSPEAAVEPHYEYLTAYLPLEQKEKSLASLGDFFDLLRGIFPDIARPIVRTSEITAADWEEEWKKFFRPLRIGKKFVVKPTWEPYRAAAKDIIIEIDPGMAFGTGQHASTAMCLEAMEDIFSQNNRTNWRVLDLGAGTGILGIAAVRLGAGRVVALDIDETAVAIARANAALNKVGETLEISSRNISSLKRPCNLILANLTAKLLMELHHQMEALLMPTGYLIISGLIEQNAGEIEACFLRAPLGLWRRSKRDEWLCYVFTKE